MLLFNLSNKRIEHMKTITRFSAIFLFLALFACNDKFLDVKPVDQLYDGNFWRTPQDLQLYCNSFYRPEMFPFMAAWQSLQIIADDMSDDIIPGITDNNRMTVNQGLRIVPGSGGFWGTTTGDVLQTDDWIIIRACNVFLQHYQTAKGDTALINHYVGVIHFFRAMDYFKKVSHFGDIPWFSKPLTMESPDLVVQKRDPRALVMDSVLADLNFAAAHCLTPDKLVSSTVNVDVVNAYKSRICLFEGTFRKNRNLAGGDKFIQAAADAAQAVMATSRYHIWKGTGDPTRNYQELFWQTDIYGTGECIMGHEYFPAQGSYQTTSSDGQTGWGPQGMSVWFVRSYLNADGTLFQPDMSQTFLQETTGRDPRLQQTIDYPGYIWTVGDACQYGDTVSAPSVIDNVYVRRGINRHYSCTTGYQMTKWIMKTLDQKTVGNGDNGHILMRYAEVLLNYAEAKAEMGTLTQGDLDMSINLIRDRVAMPPMTISPPHDPNSDWIIAGISPLPSDLIIEIRRERRVELAGEGLRRNDLMRWKAGKLMLLPAIGAKYVPAEYKENKYSALKLIPDVTIFFDANNRFWPWKLTCPVRFFDENKDYLWPIPLDVINKSNGGITQNPGW